VTLIYSVRTRQDIIFATELKRLERRLSDFRLVVSLTKPDQKWDGPSGRLRGESIAAHLRVIEELVFLLCGPEGFMSHVRYVLRSLGVDERKIHQESFGGKTMASQIESEPGVTGARIEFAISGESCTLQSSQTLLEAAELNQVAIPFGCRQGQCGTCATRLLSGKVSMACEIGLRPELRAQGYVLPCVATAENDVRLDA
jgi:ferredoxin